MLEHVAAVLVELGHGRVERDRHLVAGHEAGRPDAAHQRLERLLVGLEVGREAALVADGGGMALLVQGGLEVVEDLGAHPQRLGEGARADGDDHELLEVDRVVGVGAAVEHVHHRDRQHVGGLAAQVAPQRQALLGRRGVGGGQGHGQERVGAQAGLVRRAVERDQHPVQRGLAGGVLAADGGGDLAVDVVDRLAHPLAHPVRAAVAQLGGLELARRGAGGHRRPAPRPGLQAELDLDGRIAAAVEDLAGMHVLDLAHVGGESPSRQPRAGVVGELLLRREIVPTSALRCRQLGRGQHPAAEPLRGRAQGELGIDASACGRR